MPKKVVNLPSHSGVTINPAVYNKRGFDSPPPQFIYNCAGVILVLVILIACSGLAGVAIKCAGDACKDLTPTATAVFHMIP